MKRAYIFINIIHLNHPYIVKSWIIVYKKNDEHLLYIHDCRTNNSMPREKGSSAQVRSLLHRCQLQNNNNRTSVSTGCVINSDVYVWILWHKYKYCIDVQIHITHRKENSLSFPYFIWTRLTTDRHTCTCSGPWLWNEWLDESHYICQTSESSWRGTCNVVQLNCN